MQIIFKPLYLTHRWDPNFIDNDDVDILKK